MTGYISSPRPASCPPNSASLGLASARLTMHSNPSVTASRTRPPGWHRVHPRLPMGDAHRSGCARSRGGQRPAQVRADHVEHHLDIGRPAARQSSQRVHRTDPDLVGFMPEKLDRAGEPLVSHPLPNLSLLRRSRSWRDSSTLRRRSLSHSAYRATTAADAE